MTLSYADGVSATPLLGETIGDNLARTAAAHPDADALVSCHQGLRWTYAELDERVDRAAAALIAAGLEAGDRLGIWSPNRAEWTLLQYATARVGIIQVSVNPAYRTSELAYALRQSGCRMLVAAPSFKTSDYVAMTAEVRAGAARARARDLLRHPGVGRAPGGRQRDLHRRGARPRRRGRLRRPDQHPVHERHDRLPQGRDALPPQHPQQRLLRGRAHPPHGRGPALHPRPLLPLLRPGDGQPRLHHPRRLHGHPRGLVRARGHAARRPGRALHRPLRRAHDVHRRARAQRLRRVRPDQPAHRDHGRLAVPGRGHAAGHRPHAHGGGDHRLRHDRDLAGLDPDRRRRPARAPRRHRRSRAPARGGQGRRARIRPRPAAGRAGRAVHARLQRDARLLERPRAHRRGHRRRPLDAHRRPRDHGRRGLPEHRRADQGHDHPRRREPLPARGRGVPLHAPGHRRRPGHRRAGRALRRGAHGLDHPARGPDAWTRTACARSARARSPTTRCRAT